MAGYYSEGSYSADGTHLAYTPLPRVLFFIGLPDFVHAYWSQYHGGLAPQIWIASLADSSVVKIPHENASDFNPMWVGNKIYFLSDRGGITDIYKLDLASGQTALNMTSIVCGAMYLPPEVLIRSFLRSVMTRKPSASRRPMSPVENQPALLLRSGRPPGRQ